MDKNLKTLTTKLLGETHKKLRVYCAEKEVSIQAMVNLILEEFFNRK